MSEAGQSVHDSRAPSPVPAPPANPPRAHITRAVPAAYAVLKSLPLPLKLARNKAIVAKNLERITKTANHSLDPAAFPMPGSPEASVISLSPDDEAQLRIPAIAKKYLDKDEIPDYLIAWLSEQDSLAREQKRSIEDSSIKDLPSSAEDRIAKRRCMQGSSLSIRDPMAPTVIAFPEIMFQTEKAQANLPLPFFTQKSLRYIIDNLASLPIKKSNSISPDSKALYILDIEKLTAKLGEELSLDFGSFMQAADQYTRFQRERASDDEWISIWTGHFSFWSSRPDSVALYPAWKVAEFKLRRDTHTFLQRFSVLDYETAFNHAISEYRQAQAAQSQVAALSSKLASLEESVSRFKSFSSNRRSGNSSSNTLFQSGNRSSTGPPICLLCAEVGHSLGSHPKDKVPAKFPDGKNAWAHSQDGKLLAPDNREICLSFNIRGPNNPTPCGHGTARSHICCFCGSKSHHAFSFTCRARPAYN
ncbi:hypothetical protein JR316_0013362 [Psilocybe cubensis]|uniref:Uncharacterized protein n=2 Tax=Psilocybe cubensis TaxID=181762 RepID=A0A8H7Y8F4_PSICU|nr:hypothetical protein JR316_0013362 [Psilocybe cubensis]KAH9474894.1 hypothetical protein JR316_0013362 [Psilocybe cubensis]